MNRATLLFTLVTLISVSGTARTCPTALEETIKFYNTDYAYAFKSPASLHVRPSRKLHQLLMKEYSCKQGGESCAIDWDPWIGGQDGEAIPPVIFKVSSQKDNSALTSVEVWLDIDKENKVTGPRTTLISFRRKDKKSCWVLTEIYLGNGRKLSDLLTNEHVPASREKEFPNPTDIEGFEIPKELRLERSVKREDN